MTTGISTEQLVARLRRVRFEESLDHNGSRLVLMREYLRRSALWAQALDCLTAWPFFDIAAAAELIQSGALIAAVEEAVGPLN